MCPNDFQDTLDQTDSRGRRRRRSVFHTRGMGAPAIAMLFMVYPMGSGKDYSGAHTLPYDAQIVGSATSGPCHNK